MTLSTVATKALEQVKVGLCMLYGAGYFTDDEWIALDGLIHKGKYVFTGGPSHPTGDLWGIRTEVEEPLIDFLDWDVPQAAPQTQQNAPPAFRDLTEFPRDEALSCFESVELLARELSNLATVTPISEAPTDVDPSTYTVDSSSAETPNETSAEASSDEDYTQTAGDATHLFNLSAATTPVSALAKPQVPNPLTISSTPTLTSLESAKPRTPMSHSVISAVRGIGTKASQALYTVAPTPTVPINLQLPRLRPLIHSWASDTESKDSRAPSPTKMDTQLPIRAPKPNKNFQHPATITEQYVENYELFEKYHGRSPRALSDFYQPGNPGYRGPKPPKSSLASSKSTSIKPKPRTKPNVSSDPEPQCLAPNALLVSRHSYAALKRNHLEIKAGDTIRVSKHVSGVMWTGENLRTKLHGQFPERILELTSSNDNEARSVPQPGPINSSRQNGLTFDESLRAHSIATSPVGDWLDEVEEGNAAEWDKDSMYSKPSQHWQLAQTFECQIDDDDWDAPLPRRKRIGAIPLRPDFLTDLQCREIICGHTVAALGNAAFEKKFEEVLLVQEEFVRRQPWILENRYPPPGLKREPMYPVIPRTAVCYHWQSGRGCRYGPEDCRDLHGYIPGNPLEGTNMREGIPRWGAFSDTYPEYLKSEFFPVPSEGEKRVVDAKGFCADGKRLLTCWYWGTEAWCEHTRETCKYLHEYGEWGMAPRTGSWRVLFQRWKPKYVTRSGKPRTTPTPYGPEDAINEKKFQTRHVLEDYLLSPVKPGVVQP